MGAMGRWRPSWSGRLVYGVLFHLASAYLIARRCPLLLQNHTYNQPLSHHLSWSKMVRYGRFNSVLSAHA
jgi:hypothetical protein